MGFLKSPEIPLEGLIKIPLERLIKIPLEGNFFRFPRESEKSRTRAVGFLKTPEIPLEGNFFRFPREAEKSRTKAVRFLKSTEIPLEGLIFHPLHVADWPRVDALSHKSLTHPEGKAYAASWAHHSKQCVSGWTGKSDGGGANDYCTCILSCFSARILL